MSKPARKRENPFINVAFSVVIPVLILSKLSAPERLGPLYALILALIFPLGYAIYDIAKKRRLGFISGLGFVSTLLTGVLALYQLPVQWIAIKEATIPTLIGVAILLSLKNKKPLVEELLYNDQVINVDLVEEKLETEHHRIEFQKLLKQASQILSVSFLLSAIANYTMAYKIVKADPGTPIFNEQLARLHALHWPVVVLPSTALLMFCLWRLLKGLEKLTGLPQDQILNTEKR